MTRLRWLLMEVKDLIHGGLLLAIFMACFASVLHLSTAYLYLAGACLIAVGLAGAVVSQLQVRESADRLTDRRGKELL